MIQTGRITGREVKKNRDGTKNVLLLQVEISDPDDMQTVELVTQAGEDTNPPDDSKIIILPVGRAWKTAIAVDDGIEPSMQPGEKKLYSIDGGAISAFVDFLNTGILQLNGDADFAVRFSELETAFNELKTDFNDFITNTYNLHNHPTAPVGPVSTPSVTGTESTADISGAKIDEIKVP